VNGSEGLTDRTLSSYGRRQRWLRALELNVVAWAAGLILFFSTRNVILSVAVLAAILLGGFAWDIRKAARFVEEVRVVRANHPDWTKERVLEEVRRKR
jgi:hypothetical protein